MGTIGVAAAGILGVGGLLGTSYVLAEDTSDYPLIVQNIADKFGLNPDDVELVFEDTKDERRSNHLDHLVEDGKITEEQKTLILEKEKEMEAKREEIMNSEMTVDERTEAMQNLRDEMKAWAEENGIDLPMMGRMGDMGGRGVFGGGKGEGFGHMG